MAPTKKWLKWLLAFRMSVSLVNFPAALGSEIGLEPKPGQDPMSIVSQMEEAYQGVRDYEAVFTKQVRFEGKLSEKETIRFCFKKPFKVYMKWIKDPHKGQEVVYVQGKNDNKLRAHKGGLLSFIVVSLDPESPKAMKGSHHPVTDAGIGKLIELMGSEAKRATERCELEWKSREVVEIEGRRCQKMEAVFPRMREAGYYCYRAVLCIDCEHMLPVQLTVYDWDNRLYEKFAYEKLRVNVGIPDSRFEL